MKSHLIQFRLQKDKDEELSKIAEAINLDKSKIIRLLMNRGLIQLKKSALKVGGYNNLEISIKELL